MSSLPSRLQEFAGLCRSRLSLKIVLWIFLSIVLIEAILLVPSVARRRQEILAQTAKVTAGKVDWLLLTYPNATGTELLDLAQQLAQDPMLAVIVGGAVYGPDDRLVGQFGETPTLSAAAAQQGEALFLPGERGDRYEVSWTAPLPSGIHTLVLRHNATGARAELRAYILRILGLVLIIAAFVTLVMLAVLGPLVLSPILQLRRDLAISGETLEAFAQSAELAAQPPQFASALLQRRDELGDVIATFRQMFDRVFQAVRSQKQAEHDLRTTNQHLCEYLEQVDRVTAAAAALEQGQFQADSLADLAQRPDELGMLARVFQTMATELVQREALLRQQVNALQIEIDQQKRASQVAAIVESDYFKEMQAEMERMRQMDDF